MKFQLLFLAGWISALAGLSAAPASAGAVAHKTLRVEHGRPIVIVSQKSVLLLEFFKEPASGALVPRSEPDIRHCQARYHYQLFDGATDAVTNGQGVVKEVFQTVSASATGRQVKDAGSHVGIDAGEFHLWWSEGAAGTRSWIYYRADSPIRFIQQPQAIAFSSVDGAQFRRYLVSRNVHEFVSAGKTALVIGPAVFSGDFPTEAPTSARIESARLEGGAFHIKLSDLAANKNYVIESSMELRTGNWTPVHAFIAREADHTWADPLGKDADITFYRIREGAY